MSQRSLTALRLTCCVMVVAFAAPELRRVTARAPLVAQGQAPQLPHPTRLEFTGPDSGLPPKVKGRVNVRPVPWKPWYDRVFGTFAFTPAPPVTVTVAGTAADSNGQPVAGQPVTLVSGGNKSSTKMDARGKYSFAGCPVAPGPATLSFGSIARAVNIASQALTLDVRLPRP